MTKGRAIAYSAEEHAWLEEHPDLPRRQLHEQFCERFDRGDVGIDNIKSYCWRAGWITGRSGQFVKGQTPPNKGQICPEGKGGRHPNARRTQFKKGHLSGRAALIKQPIGAERLSKEGYLQRKVNNDLPFQARWKAVQHINWEAINGPVPKGHVLKCVDGNKLNVDPDNWLLISRSILPRLNGRWNGVPYDGAADEVKPLLIATAELQQRARRALGKGKR